MLGNRLTIAGLGLLALAMTGAIGLVVDVVFSAGVAVASAALVGLTFAVLWYVMPLRRRMARSPGD